MFIPIESTMNATEFMVMIMFSRLPNKVRNGFVIAR